MAFLQGRGGFALTSLFEDSSCFAQFWGRHCIIIRYLFREFFDWNMGTQGRNSVVSDPLQRVKVYRLNDEGKWDDRGTGHVTVDYVERSESVGLVVIDEEDNETLLIHRISADDIYRRQEDTIIAWRDPEIATELALSFQEAMGCSFIWDQICSIQRSIHFPTIGGPETVVRPINDDLEHSGTSQGNDDAAHGGNSELRELPQVELSTLPLILKTVMEGCIMDHIRVAELIVQNQTFIPKLLDLFKICEDLENNDGLHLIFKIVKGIILLNNTQIFEKLFSDEYIMDIVGALEYDPEIPFHQEHRAFLREQVLFKEAIPIRDISLLSKIHQTYRISYIKDVILPRVLDESTLATLNSIIHNNNGAVVSSLKDDNAFIQELFAKLKSPDTPDEVKKNLILFLQEFCSLSKSLLPANQMRLFRDLVDNGLFEIVTSSLQSEDRLLRLTGTDILIVVLNQDPSLLRTFMIQQQGNILFGLLVKGMSTDYGEDMHCQFLEIIRMLLDPYTMAGSQRDTIVEIFYEKHLDQLVDVITSSCPAKESTEASGKVTNYDHENGRPSSISPDILSNITELLCFCVLHHSYRIKYYLLRNNGIEKVLCLTRRKEKYLVAAAVRFLRTILSRNDAYLNRHIVNHNLFEPVIQAFTANGNRYNLLNSAVLELIEYIRKENIKFMVEYLINKFSDQLEKLDCVGTFQALKLKYEQTLDGVTTRSVSGGKGPNHSGQMNNNADQRKRADDRALEKEEEDYFNEDSDDEEDTASARIGRVPNEQGHAAVVNGSACFSSFRDGSIALVDYEDEDDDSPVPESVTKEVTDVQSISSVSSAPTPRDNSLGPEAIDTESPKRKLVTEDSSDGEPGSLKKRRLHENAKDVSVSTDSIDCFQQSVAKENCALETIDGKNEVLKVGDAGSDGLKNETGEFVVSTENLNGHEINIIEAREGSENIPSISNEASELDRSENVVKLKNPLKGKTSEGKLNASSEIVKAGSASPEPYTVR